MEPEEPFIHTGCLFYALSQPGVGGKILPMNLELEELFHCPYCGSANFCMIDHSGGNKQEFVNDCEACCKPILISITLEENIVCINVEKKTNKKVYGGEKWRIM